MKYLGVLAATLAGQGIGMAVPDFIATNDLQKVGLATDGGVLEPELSLNE